MSPRVTSVSPTPISSCRVGLSTLAIRSTCDKDDAKNGDEDGNANNRSGGDGDGDCDNDNDIDNDSDGHGDSDNAKRGENDCVDNEDGYDGNKG